MNREIKFRVWDKVLEIMFPNVSTLAVESGIYMQYTGLKDKNGVEIYEGDILTDHGDEGPLYIEYSEEHAAFVFVDKFDSFGTTLYTTTDISYGGFQIIGNIYQNPNLLELP